MKTNGFADIFAHFCFFFAFWALKDQALDLEVAEVVLDLVALQHLNTLSLKNEHMPLCLTKKALEKTLKIFFLDCPLRRTEFRVGAHIKKKGSKYMEAAVAA